MDIVTPHDLRRTFASTLNNIGVGYADNKALMNHKNKDITATYIQNNIEKLRDHLTKVVKYYDSKVKYPENIEKGWSDTVSNALQGILYGNIDCSPEPLEPHEMGLGKHDKSKEDEYWYGLDADEYR